MTGSGKTGSEQEETEETSRLDYDLTDHMPYLMNRAGALVVMAFAPELGEAGLTVPMWRILAVLAHSGAQRQIDLARLTSIDESTISRLISAMVKGKFVSRRRSATSNREVMIALTLKGRTTAARFIPVAEALEQTALTGLTKEEVAGAKRVLRLFHANLSSMLEAKSGMVRDEAPSRVRRRRAPRPAA